MLVICTGLEANSNAVNVSHSFSLDATSSWGFNGHGHDHEPSSFDQFIHGHNIGLTQPGMPVELQNTRNTQIIPPHDFDCFCPE